MPDFYGNTFTYSGQTSHVAQERKEQFVHSTVQFMEETSLTGGATASRRASLVVGNSTPPPHFEESLGFGTRCKQCMDVQVGLLLATVDVARGRDAQVEREVKIRLPK